MEGFRKEENSNRQTGNKSPHIENRRDFLKRLGLGVIATGLALNTRSDFFSEARITKEAIDKSIKNSETLQGRLLEQLTRLLESVDKIDINQATREKLQQNGNSHISQKDIADYKIFLKENKATCHEKFLIIKKIISSVSKEKIYQGYLSTFIESLVIKEQDYTYAKTFEDKLLQAKYLFNYVEHFLQNVVYSVKIVEELFIEITGESKRFFLADVESIYTALKRVPVFALVKSGLKKITLKELSPGTGAEMGGNEMAGEFSDRFYNEDTVYHELTHAFDGNVGIGENDPGWLNINQYAKPYVYSSGSEAIEATKKDEEEKKNSNIDVPGYARRYGWRGGILEDKATVSEQLFSRYNLTKIIGRAFRDPILKKKIEFMVGYRLDVLHGAAVLYNEELSLQERHKYSKYIPPKEVQRKFFSENVNERQKYLELAQKTPEFIHGIESRSGYRVALIYKFGEPLTIQDYIDEGFQEKCYWSEWSQDKDGCSWMDANYFNAILEGKKISFSEEGGKTRREIT